MTGSERQFVNIFLLNGQDDGLLDDATSYSRIELGIHIRLAVYQRLVEVDHLRLRAVDADGILMTAHIEEVECRLDHHMYSYRGERGVRQRETVGQ